MLVVGVALARSTGSDSKTDLRNAQSFGKVQGRSLESPDFQFIGQGQIVGGAGETWLIAGVPVQIDDHTRIEGDIRAGGFVVLSGRILKNGAWLADQIEQSAEKDSFFTFNGPLVSIGNGVWVIGDRSLVVNGHTELDSDLAVNDPVLVTFTLLEGSSWLALKVEHFDKPWIEPAPTPTVILAPALAPALEATDEPAPAIITAPRKYEKPSVKSVPAGDHEDEDEHEHDDEDHEGDEGDD
jgi:hypothetical protein